MSHRPGHAGGGELRVKGKAGNSSDHPQNSNAGETHFSVFLSMHDAEI